MEEQKNHNQKKSLDDKLGEKLKQTQEWVRKNKTITISLAILVILITIVGLTRSKVNWIGFGEDSNRSKTVEKELDPKTGAVIKQVEKETETFQSFKTLWDWLQLGGVLAIPIALYYFERSEQRRAEKRNELEQKQADEQSKIERDEAGKIQREDALESYVAQISQLLIDTEIVIKTKNFINNFTINKSQNKTNEIIEKNPASMEQIKESPEIFSEIIKQLNKDTELSVVLDIIRARTLSILRKLGEDGERKGEVIRFLSDVELIEKLYLNNADLNNANLKGAKLNNANFVGVKLNNVNFNLAQLNNANLRGAELNNANFKGAKLNNVNLYLAQLSNANFEGAELNNANLDFA